MGVGAECEGMNYLVFIDGARCFHVLHTVGVDAAARSQQQYPSRLGLSAKHFHNINTQSSNESAWHDFIYSVIIHAKVEKITILAKYSVI